MTHNYLKEKMDIELSELTFSDEMKRNVLRGKKKRKMPAAVKYAAAAALVFLLGGTTALAGYTLLNKVNVNDTVLPGLDSMEVIDAGPFEGTADENGVIEKTFSDYRALKDELGIPLLDSELSQENPYMKGRFTTDNKDYAMIEVENYILGDTHDYRFLPEEGWYQFEPGAEYTSPVSLTVDIILSEEQAENGWDTDYLGMYEYAGSYVSADGYKVNLIQDTAGGGQAENYVSEKCAVFVAGGIRYTLEGRVSFETMKEIVDTMKP